MLEVKKLRDHIMLVVKVEVRNLKKMILENVGEVLCLSMCLCL